MRSGDGTGCLNGPQSVNAAIKSICDILRRSSCAGAMLKAISTLPAALLRPAFAGGSNRPRRG